MVIAIDPHSTFELPLGEGDDEVIFTIRPLTARENATVQNLLAAGKPGDADLAVLEAGLVGWSNLKTEEGTAVPFPATPGEAADLLPREARLVLASRIIHGRKPSITSQTKQEEK